MGFLWFPNTCCRCAVCGLSKRSEPELRAHMAQVHGSSSTGSGTGSSTTAAASASSAAAAGGGAKSGVPMRNSYRRTLGKVALYHTWAGQAVVPPVGHQISLKYALAQEGVEVSGVVVVLGSAGSFMSCSVIPAWLRMYAL